MLKLIFLTFNVNGVAAFILVTSLSISIVLFSKLKKLNCCENEVKNILKRRGKPFLK